jgi:hypothetical protein
MDRSLLNCTIDFYKLLLYQGRKDLKVREMGTWRSRIITTFKVVVGNNKGRRKVFYFQDSKS